MTDTNPEITRETTRIGWIGTGVMGRSMCGHLIDAGYRATVFNRTRDKTRDLVDKGATWAESPRQVAEQSDVVFLIVGFPEDVESVILGDQGVLAGSSSGMTIVDMTTSRPSLAQRIAEQAAQRGVAAIDAPVSGGDTGATIGGAAVGGFIGNRIGDDRDRRHHHHDY